jgi:hypothetical protein
VFIFNQLIIFAPQKAYQWYYLFNRDKSIKKTLKILSVVILVLAGLILLLWTGLRTPALQTVFARNIIEHISEKYGIDIQVGKFRYNSKSEIFARSVLILDQKKDTLLYVDHIQIEIDELDINQHKIDIEQVEIEGVCSNVYSVAKDSLNVDFILDKFKESKKETSFNWEINCKELSLSSYEGKVEVKGRTFSHNTDKVSLYNINVDSVSFQYVVRSIDFSVNGLNLVKDFSHRGYFNEGIFYWRNLHYTSDIGLIKSNNGRIVFPKNDKGISYDWIVEKLHFETDKLVETFNFLPQIKENIELSGKVSGSKNILKIYKSEISLLDSTFFTGDLVAYLPKENKKGSYFFDIEKLKTSVGEIEYLNDNYLKQDTALLGYLSWAGKTIQYKGKVEVLPQGVDLKGELESEIGKNKIELGLYKEEDSTIVQAELEVLPIDLGRLVKNKGLGLVNGKVKVDGSFSKQNGVHMLVESTIKNIEYNHNVFDSILVSGKIENALLYGKVSSYDPRIRFDFEGSLNLDSLPVYNFKSSVYNVNLLALGIGKKDSVSSVSFDIDADFKGNTIDNSTGDIKLSNIYYFRNADYFATDSIHILSKYQNGEKVAFVKSEFVEAKLQGQFRLISVFSGIQNVVGQKLPALEIIPKVIDTLNVFDFNIFANYPNPVMRMFFRDVLIAPGTSINGAFNAVENAIRFDIDCPQVIYKGKKANDLKLNAFTKGDVLNLYGNAGEIQYTKTAKLNNLALSSFIKNDSIDFNVNWNNWIEKGSTANVNMTIALEKSQNKHKPYLTLGIEPSNISVLDTLWTIGRSSVTMNSNGIAFSNFKANNGFSSMALDGKFSDNPDDSLVVKLKNISMNYLNEYLLYRFKHNSIIFGGSLDIDANLSDLKGKQKIVGEVSSKKITINEENVGALFVDAYWDANRRAVMLEANIATGKDTTAYVDGGILLKEKELDLHVDFVQHPLSILQAFLKPNLDEISGFASGKVHLHDDMSGPLWDGGVKTNNLKLKVSETNVFYTTNDSVFFSDSTILFNNVELRDEDGNFASLNGNVMNTEFKQFYLNFDIVTNRILGINTTSEESPLYFGKVYGAGLVSVSGAATDIEMNVIATTLPGSVFNIPLEGKEDIKENTFVKFITREEEQTGIVETDERKKNYDLVSTARMNFDITVTQDAELQIIFDPLIGDVLRSKGDARLNLEVIGDQFNLYGDYQIAEGDFRFTLQDVVNKRLELQQGGSLSWSGDPLNADIDIDAIYKVRKTSLYNLTLDEMDKEKRVPVNCHLLMKNKLINPEISFEIEVASANTHSAIEQLNSLPKEDLNKQVLFLLIANQFLPLPGLTNDAELFSTVNIGATTVGEILSNQLNSWLSQINTNVGVGVAYRPGDNVALEDEYELALTVPIWKDRLIVNGNVSYGGNILTTTNNLYAYDFIMELKVNKKGNVRLRAFNIQNTDLNYEGIPYKQGFGLFYTEEFNSFDELMQRYFRKSVATKPDEVEIELDKK